MYKGTILGWEVQLSFYVEGQYSGPADSYERKRRNQLPREITVHVLQGSCVYDMICGIPGQQWQHLERRYSALGLGKA